MCDVLNAFFEQTNAKHEIAKARIINNWKNIVGDITSENAKILYIKNSILFVQATSSSWAVQIKNIKEEILKKITKIEPDAMLNGIKIVNPGASSNSLKTHKW